ncbi:MAG TPA: hypothetical protein VGM66_10535 [Candidatus Udaeobacter sp.]
MTKTKLFNAAHRLAFAQMMTDEERKKKPSGLAKHLSDQVQKLLKDSQSPELIAVEAVAGLKS